MGVNSEEALFLENETFCEEVSDNSETERKPLEFISSGNLEIDKKTGRRCTHRFPLPSRRGKRQWKISFHAADYMWSSQPG